MPPSAIPGPSTQPDAHGTPSSSALDTLAALADAQRTFATTLAVADPEAPVAACAPWRVADLALHLGGVHWWAAAMAHGVDLDPHEPPGPRDTASLVAFYGWAAEHLRSTLAARDPDAPALTLDGPGAARFWRRRQLHETLVHLWDLQLAAGMDGWLAAEPTAADSAAWADTVAEVVDTMAPRQVRLGRTEPIEECVLLVAGDRSWRLGPGTPAARVLGTPRDLALLLWHRITPAERSVQVEGDRAALDRVLARRLTP